jgi:hypothetical protein
MRREIKSIFSMELIVSVDSYRTNLPSILIAQRNKGTGVGLLDASLIANGLHRQRTS